MNGAESLVQTLVNCGVDACFANAGTSELHLVAALDQHPSIRPVLCLHEGIATGAADGYGRMADKPAMTLLHLGPGLANGLANLHNARRGQSPVVNIVGAHSRSHDRFAHVALASDIEGLARPVSGWVVRTASARDAAGDAVGAVEAACGPPGQVATLIVPADAAWSDADAAAAPGAVREKAQSGTIDIVAAALKSGPRAALLLRGSALGGAGMAAAGRIAAKTGARILYDTIFSRIQRGAGRVKAERIPYLPEAAVPFLGGIELLVLVGANPPVTLFGSPEQPSWLAPEGCRIMTLARDFEDGPGALEAVAEAIGAPSRPTALIKLDVADPAADAALNADSVGQSIAFHLPENAIVVDESGSSSFVMHGPLGTARPHDHLFPSGGSIGWGAAAAVGAAIACPDRKVVAMLGDGGAAMIMQALWSQARARLDIVTVILANRAYAILNAEWMRAGLGNALPDSYFDLRQPGLDWVALARSMGVEATRAESAGAFSDQFTSALKAGGPRLIEAVI